jgi:predicted RNA polymerase sigma factor
MGSDAASTVSAVWRLESTRLVAGLARMTSDLGLAEDLAQDAWSLHWSSGRLRVSPRTRAPG